MQHAIKFLNMTSSGIGSLDGDWKKKGFYQVYRRANWTAFIRCIPHSFPRILSLSAVSRLDSSSAPLIVIFFSRRNCRPAANLAVTPSFGGVVHAFWLPKNQADCTEQSPFRQKRPLRTPLLGERQRFCQIRFVEERTSKQTCTSRDATPNEGWPQLEHGG